MHTGIKDSEAKLIFKGWSKLAWWFDNRHTLMPASCSDQTEALWEGSYTLRLTLASNYVCNALFAEPTKGTRKQVVEHIRKDKVEKLAVKIDAKLHLLMDAVCNTQTLPI